MNSKKSENTRAKETKKNKVKVLLKVKVVKPTRTNVSKSKS
jgi:hypothetical protein